MFRSLPTTLFCLTVAWGLAACSQPTMKSVPGTEVATESGSVMGMAAGEGVVHWQDIPYAQAPVGDLRWRAPRPYENRGASIQPREETLCAVSYTHLTLPTICSV